MGLDIKAYSNLRYKDIQNIDDWDGIRLFRDAFELFELPEGIYEETLTTRCSSFRAGSYSWYNRFRNTLALTMHGVPASTIFEDPDRYIGTDFFYLINFSDCDGIIGPSISNTLFNEFTENRERFIANLNQEIDWMKETEDPIAFEPEFILDLGFGEDDIKYLIELYDNFLSAFELAADSGVVIFQ